MNLLSQTFASFLTLTLASAALAESVTPIAVAKEGIYKITSHRFSATSCELDSAPEVAMEEGYLLVMQSRVFSGYVFTVSCKDLETCRTYAEDLKTKPFPSGGAFLEWLWGDLNSGTINSQWVSTGANIGGVCKKGSLTDRLFAPVANDSIALTLKTTFADDRPAVDTECSTSGTLTAVENKSCTQIRSLQGTLVETIQ